MRTDPPQMSFLSVANARGVKERIRDVASGTTTYSAVMTTRSAGRMPTDGDSFTLTIREGKSEVKVGSFTGARVRLEDASTPPPGFSGWKVHAPLENNPRSGYAHVYSDEVLDFGYWMIVPDDSSVLPHIGTFASPPASIMDEKDFGKLRGSATFNGAAVGIVAGDGDGMVERFNGGAQLTADFDNDTLRGELYGFSNGMGTIWLMPSKMDKPTVAGTARQKLSDPGHWTAAFVRADAISGTFGVNNAIGSFGVRQCADACTQ